MQGARILSTDAEKRLGLYAIRYLGKSGAELTAIGVGTNKRDILGFQSRYVSRKIYLQMSCYDKAYDNELKRIIHENSSYCDVINPIDIASMCALLSMEDAEELSLKYLLPKILYFCNS